MPKQCVSFNRDGSRIDQQNRAFFNDDGQAEVNDNRQEPSLHQKPSLKSPGGAGEELQERRSVRVEANFLRLPLFSLDNKHMRSMDGIRCEGSFRRDGKSYTFTFIATRNARTVYPGPVARSAHFAILSFATERGLPIQNPIVFNWRELCARMDVHCSGKTIRELKEALLATKGLMLDSHHALFSKAEGKPLETAEEVGRVVGIYDELEFFGARRKDGTIADVNAVWLSRWYLDNLNALYSGPLDYELWRGLNERSFIASRLYEFLFFKFYSGRETLRFNYPNLVKFIPARTERYPSDARRQLDPAFTLLREAGVLRYVEWQQSRGGAPQVVLARGPTLHLAGDARPAGYDVGEEDFVLSQIENVRLPEWQIVADFHHRWGHDNYRPSKAELETARELIGKFGKDHLREMIPAVVKRMKVKWPDAKTFVAVTRYIDEAADDQRRQLHYQEMQQAEEVARRQEREQATNRAKDHAALKLLWETLPEQEQMDIRRAVLAKQPRSLEKFPRLLMKCCLDELARRQGTTEHAA